jgi:hypothetical protein
MAQTNPPGTDAMPDGRTSKESDGNVSTFHIYHSGLDQLSFSIHTISDRNTTLSLLLPEQGTTDSTSNSTTPHPIPEPKPLIKTKTKTVSRLKAFDNPVHDPRTASAPYFLHLPKLMMHCPPHTLRRGGTKYAPPVCLLHQSWFWRNFKLELGDVLSQEGVIDGRGVVSPLCGTEKGEGGSLRGYPIKKKRRRGESGKAWHEAWVQGGICGDVQGGAGLKEAVKPEEVVLLKWLRPFSCHHCRWYGFEWRGLHFQWRGTREGDLKTVKKALRPFLKWNHLKLILLPLVIAEGGPTSGDEEVCLAQYRSVVGKRKAGRLEVHKDAIDCMIRNCLMATALLKDEGETHTGGNASVDANPFADEEGRYSKEEKKEKKGGEKEISEEITKSRQRFYDVLMSTAFCMIISEREKRQVLIEVIAGLLGAGGG